jgi:GNAT superfamily N-acetyltransferase
MTAPVVPVAADGWRQAGVVMAHAFVDDPVFVAMLPDSGRRPRALLAIMRWVVRLRRIVGRVDTTPDGRAVAVWRPPGYRETPAAQLRAAASVPPILRYCSVADLRRLASGMSRWERRRNELMAEPHWVLEGVGVEPSRQRLGLGVVLVRHGFARADAERVPVMLEANSESNRTLWGKFGFEVIDYTDPADEPLGVPVWRMVRQPASSRR